MAVGELVAVAGHTAAALLELTEPNRLRMRDRRLAKLVVVALSLAWQGQRTRGGGRVSDAVMGTAIRDACRRHGVEDVFAIAARRNIRSLVLCERNGLTNQVAYGPHHVLLSGRFSVS